MFDELFPIVSTPNMAAVLAFYRDAMAGEVTCRDAGTTNSSSSPSRLAAPRLASPREYHSASWSNNRITLWAYTSGRDAGFGRLRLSGAQVVEDRADQPWGERRAIVLNPDGNRLTIGARALHP